MNKEDLNILCACEESQAVCGMFRMLGFNAWSCDLYPSSGGFPEYHIQGDVIPIMKSGLFNVVIAFPTMHTPYGCWGKVVEVQTGWATGRGHTFFHGVCKLRRAI